MFGVCPVLFPHPHFVLPHLKEYGYDVLGLRKFRTLMANGSAVLPQWPTGRVSNKAVGVAEGHGTSWEGAGRADSLTHFGRTLRPPAFG